MQKENKLKLSKKVSLPININIEPILESEVGGQHRNKIKELKFEIKSCRDSIKRLFAFAAGEKNIKNTRIASPLQKSQRTEDDDRRMLKTVAYLRQKIKQLELEITTLSRR